jgi:hypothetical protein
VVFGCETNALVVELGFIERQVPAADQQLYQIMKQYRSGIEHALEDGFHRSERRRIHARWGSVLARARKLAMVRAPSTAIKEYGFDFKKLRRYP